MFAAYASLNIRLILVSAPGALVITSTWAIIATPTCATAAASLELCF
jgi:hypothetical protein